MTKRRTQTRESLIRLALLTAILSRTSVKLPSDMKSGKSCTLVMLMIEVSPILFWDPQPATDQQGADLVCPGTTKYFQTMACDLAAMKQV